MIVGKRKERSGEEFDEREVVDKNLNPLTPTSSDFKFISDYSSSFPYFGCLYVCESMLTFVYPSITLPSFSFVADLCNPRHETEDLSPRKVMMTINYYKHDFNLTNQQDAEEAFLHILSSLREELADMYVFNYGSLAKAVCLLNNRILSRERRDTQIELQRRK
ncbi:hypothetical protein AgCh_039024 [Apium graveolens]